MKNFLWYIFLFLFPQWSKAEIGCGKQSSNYLPLIPSKITRIIGGNIAKPHSWPWQVSVRMYDQHICGGSILRVNHKDESDLILTAGHCVLDDKEKLIDISHMTVLAGSYNKKIISKGEHRRNVADVKFHQNFTRHPLVNDIAILRLDKPINFSQTIRPVCLPRTDSVPIESICMVTGWGRNESLNEHVGQHPDKLKQALMQVHSIDTCKKLWKGGDNWDYARICAGPMDGHDYTCMGDSGGPLVCRNEDKTWSQQGIVSSGGSAQCTAKNKPPAFTRVAKYRKWIEERIKEMSVL